MVGQILRFVCLVLARVLCCAGCFAQTAASTPPAAQTVKNSIQAHGAGAGVTVTQLDGTRVNGILGDIRADDFDVVVKGAPHPTTVRYAEARSVQFEGKHHLRNILMYTGLGFAALFVIAVIAMAAGGGP